MSELDAAGVADPLVGYRLRTVRIGTWVTVLTLLVLAGYAFLPGHGKMNADIYSGIIVAGAVAAIIVATLPWPRLLEYPFGMWAMYIWSGGDIALISVAVAVTGGGTSEIWAVYALTTLFFAATYPTRGQLALLGVTAIGYVLALAVNGWNITAASLLLRFSLLLLVFLMASFLARELRVQMESYAEASLRARNASAEARRSEWFRALVQEATDVVTSFDVEGKILYISPAARAYGYDPDELVGTDVAALVHPEDLDRVVEQLTQQVDFGDAPRPIEYRARSADGSYRYLEGVATNLLDDPVVGAIVVDARDVTDRKNAEILLASQSLVLQEVASGEALDVVLRRIAMMVEEQAHAQCTIVVHGTDEQRLLVVSSDPRHRDLLVVDTDGSGWSREIRSSRSNDVLGEVRLRFAAARFATDREQQVGTAAANLAAIVLERDSAASQLAHQASHDSLTGLPNRQVLLGAIEEILTHPESDQTLALLFVDLDGFKDVNDSFGHHVGDQVLIALGHRLTGALRKHDLLARFGGDEFVALCRVDDLEHARHLAGRVMEKVRQPIAIGSHRVRLDSSIGIATAHLTGEIQALTTSAAWVQATADELVHEADRAMYRAKESGGGRIEVWETGESGPQLRAAADPE